MTVGYRRKATLYTLKWPDGHDLAGLEVTMRGLSIDAMMKFIGIAADLTAPTPAADVAAVRAKAARADEMFALFARNLVAWNLEEDDGTPVPASLEGAAAQGADFIAVIMTTWMEEVASVDTPLPPASPNGATTDPAASLVGSLPMDVLSPSPGN